MISSWVTNLWAANLQDLEEMNYEFERETGFINSQPSLAECLTSFPPVGDAFQSSSIKSSTLSHSTLIPPPFEQTIPSLNPGSHPRHSRPKQNPNGLCPLPAASLPPEYPWMKEKKASKKNQTTSTATTTDPGPLYFSPQGIFKLNAIFMVMLWFVENLVQGFNSVAVLYKVTLLWVLCFS